jgi:purine-binding chemotaxis protein CheW
MQTMTMEGTATKVAVDERAGNYLTFRLGSEEFGVRVDKVREIMGAQEITSVPQTTGYLRGVINLRGKVVPVVDLRLKFGLEAIKYTQRTCIVVVQMSGEAGIIQVGLLVDTVSEVRNMAAADLENTPDFSEQFSAPCIHGMAKLKGKATVLLDIDRVVSAQEIAGFESLVGRE